MRIDVLASLRRLSDIDLVARVKDLAGRERGTVAHLIAHLAELDLRDLHLKAGHGSLFVYCRDVLALSEQESYARTVAVRAIRRFPVILNMLEDGGVNLTTVRLLVPHLTPENHKAVLESARGKRKAQVEEIAAALAPVPDVPSSVRKLPEPKPFFPPRPAPDAPPSAGAPPPDAPAPVAHWQVAPAPAPASGGVVPLSPGRYRVQVTIGGDTLEKLRLAKDLLRHALPSGDEAAILDRALTALLADLAQKKFAAAEHPRGSSGAAPGSRHVPAEVKRAVWLRDLGRCAFLGADGRRCAEHAFLEFHHVRPYAAGGGATIANIQLRCRSHNGYEARVFFGR